MSKFIILHLQNLSAENINILFQTKTINFFFLGLVHNL